MVTMTDEQKYDAVLKELGAVLAEKNTTISCQKWQIDELKEKLEAAEAELREDTKAFDAIMKKAIANNEHIAALYAISARLCESVNLAALEPDDFDKVVSAQNEIRDILCKLEGGAA